MYDNVGNRTSMMVTDSSGVRMHVYTYDDMMSLRAKRGNLQITAVDYPSGFDYLATDTTFNYDAAGNRTSVIDGSGTSTYTTNSLNEYTAAGTASYQYDASGNMTHDNNYAYGYDPENRLVAVQRSGSLPAVTLGQALESPLAYTTGGDAAWTVTQTAGHGDFDSAYSGELEADQSNWLQTTVQGAGTFSFWWETSSSDTASEMYFYIDGTARSSLTGDQETWQQQSYTITGSGAHTLKWTFSRSSDPDTHGAGFVDSVQWTGSALPAPEPPTNAWHRLTYTYDPSGRRIEKKYDGELITRYVYDGDHCIAEYDINSNLKRKYIYGPCVDEPVCMIEATVSPAATYYYHFDALGSVVALTNGSGNTVEVYEYDVYGRVGMADANHPNRFLFTGREFDKETGLYYYRARYYNPQIGRFLQTDPVGYSAGMNCYAYCDNNPVDLSDPLGTYAYYNDFAAALRGRGVKTADPNYYRPQGYGCACVPTSIFNLYAALGKYDTLYQALRNDPAYAYNNSTNGGTFEAGRWQVWMYVVDAVERAKGLPTDTILGMDQDWNKIGVRDLTVASSAIKTLGGLPNYQHATVRMAAIQKDPSLLMEHLEKGPMIMALNLKPNEQTGVAATHAIVVKYSPDAKLKDGTSAPYEIIDSLFGTLNGGEPLTPYYVTEAEFQEMLGFGTGEFVWAK
jgi:RHS repeat-associated protein